ncbi:hypothetical protein BJ875DRAFT_449385 [Amylocarpus encephaloides]|uniref:Early meiotic induction protein 1 n=1 Tax=Amylocarpus encephaloides TaxID=45428 RepID=A0A9P7YST5_9HELO|nr:hypothetical protein BJ875DRAFT_449385 [Amylocarpus encephaloides]
MGWLWSTPAPASPDKLDRSSIDDTPILSSKPDPSSHAAPPKQPSREEIAEQELHSFLQELNADVKPSRTKYNRVPRAPLAISPPDMPSDVSSPDPNLPISEQLLPTYMSCRVAFDEAFYCNSFGGKFNDLYRYGGLKSCSENWNKFWFCMRTRTWSENQKKGAIKDYYRKREKLRYGANGKEKRPSSEDIWKSRESKVEWGESFKVDPDDNVESVTGTTVGVETRKSL